MRHEEKLHKAAFSPNVDCHSFLDGAKWAAENWEWIDVKDSLPVENLIYCLIEMVDGSIHLVSYYLLSNTFENDMFVFGTSRVNSWCEVKLKNNANI